MNKNAQKLLAEIVYDGYQNINEEIQSQLMNFGVVPDMDLGMLMENAEKEYLDFMVRTLDTEICTPFEVHKFMTNIKDVDKSNYNVIYQGHAFDIAVFEMNSIDDAWMQCELCDGTQGYKATKFIGTGDTREPKYCFPHYKEVNRDSKFVWVGKGGK